MLRMYGFGMNVVQWFIVIWIIIIGTQNFGIPRGIRSVTIGLLFTFIYTLLYDKYNIDKKRIYIKLV